MSGIPVFKMALQYSELDAKKIGMIDFVCNLLPRTFPDNDGGWVGIFGIAKMDNPDNYVQIHTSVGDKHKFMGYNSFGILVSDKLAAVTIFVNGGSALFEQPEFARLKGLATAYVTAGDVEDKSWVKKNKAEKLCVENDNAHANDLPKK